MCTLISDTTQLPPGIGGLDPPRRFQAIEYIHKCHAFRAFIKHHQGFPEQPMLHYIPQLGNPKQVLIDMLYFIFHDAGIFIRVQGQSILKFTKRR